MAHKISNKESNNYSPRDSARSTTDMIDAHSNEGLFGNPVFQRVIDYEVEKKIAHYIKKVNEDIQKKDEQIKELSNKANKKVNDQWRNDVRSQFGLIKNERDETVIKLRSVTIKYFECKKILQDRDEEIGKLKRHIEILNIENKTNSYLISSQQDHIYILINDLDDKSKIKELLEKNKELQSKIKTQMDEIKEVHEKENSLPLKSESKGIHSEIESNTIFDSNLQSKLDEALKTITDLKKDNELLRINNQNNSGIDFNNFIKELATLFSDKVIVTKDQIKEEIELLVSSNNDRGLMIASLEEKNQQLDNQLTVQINLYENLMAQYLADVKPKESDDELNEEIKRLEKKFKKKNSMIKDQLKNIESENKYYREETKRKENELKEIQIDLTNYIIENNNLKVKLESALTVKISLEKEIEKLKEIINTESNKPEIEPENQTIKRLNAQLKDYINASIEYEKNVNDKIDKINQLESEIKKLKHENAEWKASIGTQPKDQQDKDIKNGVPCTKKITVSIIKKGKQLEHKIYDI